MVAFENEYKTDLFAENVVLFVFQKLLFAKLMI
jgi:ketol-acid reductoisomerase